MYGTLAVCLFVFVSEISTFQPWNVTTGFHYTKGVRNIYRRADTEDCRLCDGDLDCLSLDEARCELYLEASAILSEDEETTQDAGGHGDSDKELVLEIRTEMDSMMYKLVDKAYLDQQFRDCIPLISQYTDCNKDNICLGCSTCVCDIEGKWNCTMKQHCKPDSALDINHRVLLVVLDKLKSDHKISKRSIAGDPYLASEKPEKVAYEELVEWMYGDHPLRNDHRSNLVKPTIQYPSEKLSNLVKRSITETTTDWRINFDDNIFGWFNRADQLADVENSTVLNNDIVATMNTITTVKPTTQYPSEKLSNLVKRSLTETTTDGRINFDDIFGWFNRADQLADVENSTVLNNDTVATTNTTTTEINTTTTGSIKSEPEILAFEEVLNIIADDNKNHSGRNPLDVKQNEQIKDYMDLDDIHIFYNIPNVTETMTEYTVTEATVVEIFTESVINEVATVVIDLLKTPKTNTGEVNSDDYSSFLDDIDIDNEVYIRNNDSIKVELNAVNVMKREIQVNDTIETTTLARMNTTQNFVTDFVQDLNSNVLRPLNNIIHDKKNEIYELTKIKDNLISFMKTNNYFFNDNETVTQNKQPSYLSIYNLQVSPPFLDDLRKSNTSILDNYLTKLKRDVIEVIKDIVGIQKYSDPTTLPEDIKFLIRAMKYYVHKNGFHTPKKVNTLAKNFRRNNWESVENSDENSVVHHLTRMLESIDKDMPSSNALQPFSLRIRKIMKRIIKQHYTDEFSVVGLKVYDPHYNLTNDINNIGTKWEKISTNIINSLPSERIYHLKLLHMILSIDVHKMNDALALIDFAHSRRMVPVDENIGEEIMSKINLDLRAINQKVMSFIKKKSINEKIKATRRETKNHRKKESFLNQIRKLLRNSKTDIRKLLHKKVPKTAIVKELARKKLDRLAKRKLSEYEQTMRKWQSNLKIPTGRQKRSAVFGNRMKNIIPMYLRGKVNYTVHNKRRRKVHSTTTMPKISATKKKKKFH